MECALHILTSNTHIFYNNMLYILHAMAFQPFSSNWCAHLLGGGQVLSPAALLAPCPSALALTSTLLPAPNAPSAPPWRVACLRGLVPLRRAGAAHINPGAHRRDTTVVDEQASHAAAKRQKHFLTLVDSRPSVDELINPGWSPAPL